MAFPQDQKTGFLLIGSCACTVSVMSDTNNTVVASVTVGNGPFAVAYDSGKAEMFVARAEKYGTY